MPNPTANLIKPIFGMPKKSIAELIHDRVFAEGGTLNRWLNGAKFRRLQTRINSRMVSTASDEEILDCMVEFKPSPELEMMIRRNVDEVRDYMKAMVAEWREEVARAHRPKVAAGPRVLPEGEGGDAQGRKGRDDCDCHAVTWSSISEVLGKSAPSAVVAVAAAGLWLICGAGGVRGSVSGDFAEIQRVESGVLADRASVGPFGGKPSRFNVELQGMGAGVLGAVVRR